MRALGLSELREILDGAAFAAWWTELTRAVTAHQAASERQRDLRSQTEQMELRSELVQRSAMDAFSRGGEAEEAAARLGAEGQELENRALSLVGVFEEQRFRSSDLWYRMGGLERTLEDTTDPSARKPLERQLPVLQREFHAEDAKREKLWAEVEALWDRSLERSLLSNDHAARARRIRREAERLFKEADERRQRARQLAAEAEAADREVSAAAERRTTLLERAAREFGCAHGERFLYWRHRDDKRAAFAVALVDEAEGHDPEVKALSVFRVGPRRGVGLLEPAREGMGPSLEEGERRFDEYLRGPPARPGSGEGQS
jgi:hypothetical protein